MLGRKTYQVAGAAILGSLALLGANIAHAIVDLDATDKTKAAVTYAKELLKTSSTHGDADYYTVTETAGSGGDTGLVKAKLGLVVAANKNAVVTFTFQNLVFLHASTAPAPSVTDSSGSAIRSLTPVHTGGGTTGNSTVTYALSPTVELPADTVFSLDMPAGGVGISASAPVSITMDVSAEPAEGTTQVTHQASYPNAIDAMSSTLTVTSTPNSVTAAVEDGYRKFMSGNGVTSDRLKAGLGTFAISAESRLKPDGDAVAAADLYAAGTDAAIAAGGEAPADSSIVIKGDFSFASKVTLQDDTSNCAGDRDTDLLLSDDKTQLAAQNLAFATGKDLCIEVSGADDAMAIAEGDYSADITYKLTDAVNAEFASATASVTYGSIGRDGATVRIPYLVTDERYNQRIVIVNYGAATTYETTFTTEGDHNVTARAGARASGALPSGTTVLRTRDVVTIEGGPPHRASGIIKFGALAGTVTVATNQTNRQNGSTDTVVYETRD